VVEEAEVPLEPAVVVVAHQVIITQI